MLVGIKEFIEIGKKIVEEYNIQDLDSFRNKFDSLYPYVQIPLVSNKQEVFHHTGYTVATDVYMLNDGFVGIYGGFSIDKDSDINWNDTNIKIEFYPYESVLTIVYKRIIDN